jgi:hypothetical protein
MKSLYLKCLATLSSTFLKYSFTVTYFSLFYFSLENNIYLVLDSITYFGKKGDSIIHSVTIWGALNLSPRSWEDN